jgi:hypothetical protein
MNFDPDIVYNDLSKEEQEVIDKEVEEAIKKKYPHIDKVSYTSSFITLIERKKIVYAKYGGNMPIKPNIPVMPVIEQDEKDVEIRELKEEIEELREQLKSRDGKIMELEFTMDMLKEENNHNGIGKSAA